MQFAKPDVFIFFQHFKWLSSAGNSDKGDGDKHEGVHESTVRGNSRYSYFLVG